MEERDALGGPSSGTPSPPGILPHSSAGAPDFRAIFEAAPGAHLVLAPDSPRFTMLAASDERLAVTLTTREETIGQSVFDVFADANPENLEPSGVANLRASLETVLRTRAPHRMSVQRYDLRCPDGGWEVRYWVPRNVPVLASDGTVRYLVHYVQDVTELVLEREAAAAVERREAELRAVLESMSDGVLIAGADGISLANRAALQQLGYARREDLNRRIGALVEELRIRDAATGVVIPLEQQPLVRALTGERVVQDLLVRHRVTGTDHVMHCVAAPVVIDGAAIAAVAVHTDITEQVRARREIEALLEESNRARVDAEAARARSDAVLESIADAFYLVDREWRFTYVNDAAEPLLHTTREALLGRTLWEAFPEVVGSPFEDAYREAIAGGRPTAVEGYFAPLGTWFDVRSYPWAGGLMVHFRDVGARKAAEAERERLLEAERVARAEAEAANRAKGEFLAVMSHELRTPLNAIGGYAELLELGIRGSVTEAQRADLARIQQSQRHLLGLINQVLNYTRVDAGAVQYDRVEVPVAEALAAAEALVLPQARARGLTCVFGNCLPGLTVRADSDKLQQILLNLLTNAIKFTEPGGQVRVGCEAREGWVAVSVADTGIGIPPDKLGSIFEPFVQVDQGLTRAHEGVGLGLAISRELARGMGGDLTVESMPAVGSTFTLTLPYV